jgi:hypothetical protein
MPNRVRCAPVSVSDSIRRFFNLQPRPTGSGGRRQWLILTGVGLLGLLVGVGVGASGKEKTSTVTVAGGVTTVRVAKRAPAHTVTQTVVHVHVHIHTVTHTVTVQAAESSPGDSSGEEEGGGGEEEEEEEGGGAGDEVGSTSHATDGKFCSEHQCIGDFEGENGTIVECSDGTYSHAGGISGACSDHGGES